MPKYIDADEFVKIEREWYCEQCQNRKGMKRGKLQFVYEIGDAPCRACDVDDVISNIEDFPAADVEPVKHAYWIDIVVIGRPAQACSNCHTFYSLAYTGGGHPYCPNCGANMLHEPPKDETVSEITPEMIEAAERNQKRIKERIDRIYDDLIAEKRAEIEWLKAEIAKMPPFDAEKLVANPPVPPKETDGDEQTAETV